jgi:hypothetical protein
MRMLRQLFGPSRTSFRARLTLEALDGRLPPSSLIGTDPSTDSSLVIPASAATTSQTPTANPTNTAPQIINFTNVEVVGGVCTFSGDVVDEAPAGLTITLDGQPPSVRGVTVTTDANGHFAKSVLMKAGDNGIVTAETVDAQGLASNVPMTLVTGN